MTAQKSPHYHVVVIGAGITGLGAAIALALKGHTVTVLERASSLQETGSVILVPPQIGRLFDSFGVYNKLIEKDSLRDTGIIYRYDDASVIGKMTFGWQKAVYGYP
jgi:salicylate hydroxylase